MAGQSLLTTFFIGFSGLSRDFEPLLHREDAAFMLKKSGNLEPRVARTNDTAAKLTHRLALHPAVDTVHYPALSTPGLYDAFRRPGGARQGGMKQKSAKTRGLGEGGKPDAIICLGRIGSAFVFLAPGGHGGLFSVDIHTDDALLRLAGYDGAEEVVGIQATIAFYDSLDVAKGPGLT